MTPSKPRVTSGWTSQLRASLSRDMLRQSPPDKAKEAKARAERKRKKKHRRKNK
jgi:hypothetical protein